MVMGSGGHLVAGRSEQGVLRGRRHGFEQAVADEGIQGFSKVFKLLEQDQLNLMDLEVGKDDEMSVFLLCVCEGGRKIRVVSPGGIPDDSK